MVGLLAYLAGPGRANEHTDPCLVTGDETLLDEHDAGALSAESARAVARHLDRPKRVFGTEVKGGHVWHCSLSLPAEEGALSSERWAEIARDFVAGMGFDDPASAGAPCRWAAVRHGVSANGNDHVHLVVNLVREDGTTAPVFRDYRRAQDTARALEAKHGLVALESARDGYATRGWHRGEAEAQARARAQHGHGRPAGTSEAIQPRHGLAVQVRAAATAARDEAEFVRRLRGAGVLVRPRFAEGGREVVAGYSVAARPRAGERPVWYGGGRLAKDLTLPRLRQNWPAATAGADAGAAVAEWNAAHRGRRPVAAGRETVVPDPRAWARCDVDLARLIDRLGQVPPTDRAMWATVARQTAGALAAWSAAIERPPGDLVAAAEALSRTAQTHRATPTAQATGTTALSTAAGLLATVSNGGRDDPAAQAAVQAARMVQHLLRLAQAIHTASVTAQQTRHARLLADDTRTRLVRIRDSLPRPVAHTAATPPAGRSRSPQARPYRPAPVAERDGVER